MNTNIATYILFITLVGILNDKLNKIKNTPYWPDIIKINKTKNTIKS